MEAIALFLLVLFLLLLGAPIAIALGLASVLHILVFGDDTMSSVALKFFESNSHYTLLAIPFFILSSGFMATGGVARRMIRLSIAAVGSFRGGLAMAGVFSCMLFAALSGSSPATVAAIGGISIAGMRQAGYGKDFAAGVICNAGTLGILIPPSIVMVVYAAATDVSVGRMFLGGVVPGLVAGGMLMIGIYIAARRQNLPAQPWRGFGEVWRAARDAMWGLLLVVIVLGGIYGGVFTPTEAAAVVAVYSFLIVNFMYRDLGPLRGVAWRREGEAAAAAAWRGLRDTARGLALAAAHPDNRRVLVESSRTTVMLMFIIANALLFAHVLTTERVPQTVTSFMIGAGFEWWSFLIAVNLLLLLGGQFMEPSGLLLIVAPVVFPLALELGIDPIHLGIMMVVNMEIGLITPPVGLNLFVTAGVAKMPLPRVARAAAPWLMILLLFLLLVTYAPFLSTALPNALMGPEIVSR